MQNFKILLGIIMAIAGNYLMITKYSKEHGDKLIGSMAGYIIISGIAIWLIYSGRKAKSKE